MAARPLAGWSRLHFQGGEARIVDEVTQSLPSLIAFVGDEPLEGLACWVRRQRTPVDPFTPLTCWQRGPARRHLGTTRSGTARFSS